jgi:hypothetical protein
MKKRVISVALLIAMCLIGSTSSANEEPTLIPMHATAYCLPGKTASGEPVREGICATGRKELFGKTVILYQRLPDGSVGKGLGIYEVKDSGCNENVIDVWRPDLDWCQNFMNIVYQNGAHGCIYVEVIEDAKG